MQSLREKCALLSVICDSNYAEMRERVGSRLRELATRGQKESASGTHAT